MSRSTDVSSLRRLRDAALLACTIWLLVQNFALLALVPWDRAGVVLTVVSALTKAAITLIAPLWMIPVLATLGLACMMVLLRDSSATLDPRDREVRHG